MAQSFALILAWPETHCKRAGAWYDGLMQLLNVSSNGYYRVGHAAIVLVNGKDGECRYFDFGRYHAPHGHGRVRDAETDHDLIIRHRMEFDEYGCPITTTLIADLENNVACHGYGKLKVGFTPINFDLAYCKAKEIQGKQLIPYGPFVINGTNCSRFVRTVTLKGTLSITDWIKLALPPMLTPTPMWNILAVSDVQLPKKVYQLILRK